MGALSITQYRCGGIRFNLLTAKAPLGFKDALKINFPV
jgi:hypothetical protein